MHYYDRRIGKTYSLLKLAHKYKCPIVVPNYNYKAFIKSMNRNFYKDDVEIIIAKNMRGIRHELLLCEEGIESQLLHDVVLRCCKRLVSYVSYY